MLCEIIERLDESRLEILWINNEKKNNASVIKIIYRKKGKLESDFFSPVYGRFVWMVLLY